MELLGLLLAVLAIACVVAKLAGAMATLVDATPLLAKELIALAMDSRNKPYSRVNAMPLVF